MAISSRILGRAALGIVVAFAVVRVLDPYQRWAALPVPGDMVEHAAVVFLLSLVPLAAFPRLKPWTPGAMMLAVGVGLEALQATPFFIGDFQMRDVVADAVGVGAAWIGLAASLAWARHNGKGSG